MKKEKTSRRLPFSVFQPGCLDVRFVPEERPGKEAELRVLAASGNRG
jgi:hypothetical protein